MPAKWLKNALITAFFHSFSLKVMFLCLPLHLKLACLMTLLQVFALQFENIDNKKQHIKMKKTMITLLAAGLMFAGCGKQGDKDNPLLQKWDTPFETAPFEKIKPEHYLPAFEAAIA